MSSRGFNYASFNSRYGEKVTVDGSSVAGTCWLRVNTAKSKNDFMGGERVEADALLTVPQARILVDALNAFIEDMEDEP